MFVVKDIYEATYEVKKSKFISYLLPIDEFKTLHDKLRLKHPKARHIVWAYRKLNDLDQIVENSTDDAEPKGAAGVPTLNVLRGNDLINSAILSVRYFGGIKLGVGGMVRAYTNAAKNTLEKAKLIKYEKKQKINFQTTYKVTKQYEHFFDSLEIKYDRVFESDGIKWSVNLSDEELKEYLKRFKMY